MEGWKRNLLILWFAQFLVMGAMSQIIPFLPLYLEEDLGVHEPNALNIWTGLIFGINFFSAFIFSPIWGSIADRIGRKVMVLRSGFGMAIITALMGFVTSPEQLFLLRLLNGMISGFIPASIALVSTNTPKEKAGFALGTLQSGSVAGSIMGPAIGGIMADIIGYRNIFFVTGTLLLMAGLLVLFMVKEENKPNPKVKTGEGFVKDFRMIIKTGPILPLFCTGMLIQFALIGTNSLLSIYVKDILGTAEYVAFFSGLVVSVTGIANMTASPFLGKLGDRIGSQNVLYYALLGSCLVMLPHAFVNSIWQLLILRFLLGLTLGGLIPAVNTLIRHYAPKGMESRTFGYANSAMFIGNMFGPITGAFISTWFDIHGVFVFASLLLLFNMIWVRVKVRVKQTDHLVKNHS